jgi:hypothetical protein
LNKERIKSVILVLLIVNCIQLTGQIWLDEKLWPSGYNFFHSMEDLPLIGSLIQSLDKSSQEISSSMLYDTAIQPKNLVVNVGATREVYSSSHSLYAPTLEYMKSILSSLLSTSSPQSTVISMDQFESLFRGNSIYMDFGFTIDGNNLAKFCGLSASALQFPTLSGILFVSDTFSNDVLVCVLDQGTGTITQYWSGIKSSDFLSYIDQLPMGQQQGYTFAFEVNLDKQTTDTGVEQKVVLDPFVMLPMSPSSSQNMIAHNYLSDLETIGQIADHIVTAFGYNSSSLRKTVTQEGVVSYVENSATVRVHPDGLVEYNAVSAGRGIPLSASNPTAQQAVSAVLDVAKEVWASINVEEIPEVHLQSDLIDSSGDSYIVGLSYYFNGTPIFTQSNNGKPAIYAEISNGQIQSFQMMLFTYEQAEGESEVIPVLTAIDRLFEYYQDMPDEITIQTIFECYVPRENEAASVQWAMEILGSDGYVIVP